MFAECGRATRANRATKHREPALVSDEYTAQAVAEQLHIGTALGLCNCPGTPDDGLTPIPAPEKTRPERDFQAAFGAERADPGNKGYRPHTARKIAASYGHMPGSS
ncbi:hypothetical protein [Roseibium sp. MMSF_3412]|uniref:hypothetical protein n=1 Tax=Roseibium sp. MMSF_3412 TaxID=3046712 RepID=UPI00273E9C39|nr:hypothetical protein [Roseibium sp. MMSF_3412]